jgi:hypothetical protein
MSEINVEALKRIYEELKELKESWAPDDNRDIDDAEEMWTEIPEFLRRAVPEMGLALGIVDYPGLYISYARYESEREGYDVTDLLRSNVKDNKLEMQVLNPILGRDPDYGQKKLLRVEYRLKGDFKEVQIPEGEWLRI